MVAPVFEHITAIIFVSMLFVSAVIAVPAISYLTLLYVDQQQLRNLALEALNSILLGMGYPSEWGLSNPFNASDVTKFGLALSDSSSFYVLDPVKVQRLDDRNPSGSLDYETMRTLLGLQDYGFNIKIIPPFNVTVTDKDETPSLLYEVNVTFNDGRPIPNAHVEATLLYVTEEKGPIHVKEITGGYSIFGTEHITNWLGQCMIEQEIFSNITGYIVTLRTTVADLTTITTTCMEGVPSHVANVSIIGDNITLSIPDNVPGWWNPNGVIWVEGITAVGDDGNWDLYSPDKNDNTNKINFGQGFGPWSSLFNGLSYYDPILLIFKLSVPQPRRSVLFVGPQTTASGYRIFNFGSTSTPSTSGAVLKLQRNVEIAGMTYLFELLLWKEV